MAATPAIPVTVIILAAQRHGVVNPLARRGGVSHKCLVPICGKPLIAHVMDTITALPAIVRIRVVLEAEGHGEVGRLLEAYEPSGIPVELIDSSPNIVDSVLRATKGEDGPFVITTADNVLMTPLSFEKLRGALADADGAVAVTTRERVWAVHRQGQRNFYELKEAAYANCNLYGLANQEGLAAAEIFREGGQFQRNRGRMIRAFGLLNILLMRFRLVTLAQGLRRAGKRFGAKLAPVPLEDGTQAIDVDNERTYAIAEWVLGQRLGMDIPKPEIPADSR